MKQAPYTPQCGALAGIPQASRLAQLGLAEQYAAIELFRGTMVSHSAIVYRNDNPAPQDVGFAGDDWPGYVPLQMADTKCLQERLPPGAAAVLLYPGHTFRDLVMPIDATELSLFAGIDGNRSIGDIVEGCRLTAASRRGRMSPVASSSGCGGTTRWCSTRHGNARGPVCRRAWHLDTAEKNL